MRGMRRGLTGLALVMLVGVAACSGSGSSQPTEPAPVECASGQRPAVALLLDAQRQPLPGRAACLARTYTNIIGAPAWDDLPVEVAKVSDSVFTWQRRVLQYGFDACAQCPQPGLDVDEVREAHPEWILRDAAGNEVHPAANPDWVLFDFSNVDFQAAWTAAVTEDLAGTRWTGIDIVDASNQPNWSGQPVDPLTGKPMTESDRRTYLAQALSVVRAGMKTSGFSLVAHNAPAAIVDSGQIASTDAVTVGAGFARLVSPAWDVLFAYFQTAVDAHVGAWVEDRGTLDLSQRVFGLASYLLVSGPRSSYAVDSGTEDEIYDLSLGEPLDVAALQGFVWLRPFASGYVAVNPTVADGRATLADGTVISVPAGGAVIQTPNGRFATPG
jgi:hypothetical protein